MSRLRNLFDVPEAPEGFVWLLPADGGTPVLITNASADEDSTLELLWSDTLTNDELTLLAARGDQFLAIAAGNALTARQLQGADDVS